jgi:antirestriction protein ArdC
MAIPTSQVRFAVLLQHVVSQPGILSQAYSQFHNYSLGNVLLAAFQCAERGIPLGPMATYNRWKELGRHVRKGEKAITLCQPVTVRKASEHLNTDEAEIVVRFTFRNSWFVLAQTDGEPLNEAQPADWDRVQALAALDITEIPFSCASGNVLGYAKGREVAINPVNPFPLKTLFHELAHVVLGHTAEGDHADSDTTPRNVREVEAETVALLCLESLGLPGAEHCRGYVQHWWTTGEPIPERSAQRILRVADRILKAGRATDDGERP